MTEINRAQFLDRIRADIADAGHHVTLVQGGEQPRFAYTIGLTDTGLPEVVLAATTSLSANAVFEAIEGAAERVRSAPLLGDGEILDVPGVGAFTFVPVDPSWTSKLLLGALDYYDRDDVPALQMVPETALRTIDVPDLAVPFDPRLEPVWRWLVEPWDFPVPSDAITMTNLAALHGEPISQAGRWESDHWELFTGHDIAEEDARAIPLATLLGFDPTLEPVVHLEVGGAIRRAPPGEWETWEPSAGA
jgi:Domain of unknown function (DUF4262)